jgi:hypothetical protein
MARKQNTDTRGNGFAASTVAAVWQKAPVVAGYDPAVWRKDTCGAFIRRADHGDTTSQYGWEIDHIRPVAHGGTDDLSNLQALQWENNRYKSDNYPQWSCKVRAA